MSTWDDEREEPIKAAANDRRNLLDLARDSREVNRLVHGARLSHPDPKTEPPIYRWLLWRNIHPDHQPVCWIMLNPSTADTRDDDPTIRRCLGFTKLWRQTGILIVNLFAFRATNPNVLLAQALKRPEEIGVDDKADREIQQAISSSGIVVCAWGANASHRLLCSRVAPVVQMIRAAGKHPMCLGTTRDGEPRHPLMLPYDTKLEHWV